MVDSEYAVAPVELQTALGKRAEAWRNFEQWLRDRKGRTLRLPDDTLDILIPERLLELVHNPSKVDVVRSDEWLGGYDNGFEPAIGVLIIERDRLTPSPTQEGEHPGPYDWGKAINTRRARAIQKGLLSDRDKVLISLIAHDYYGNGVEEISIIIAEDLRGRGLAKSFYKNWDIILRKMGYTYRWGEANPNNVDIFLRLGEHRASELRAEALEEYPKLHNLISTPYPDTTVIKFLDEEMKRKCLK